MKIARSFVYLLLCVLSAACTCSADVAERTVLEVDWSEVPETPSKRTFGPEIGSCICDQHAGACDPNCCCDDQCSKYTIETGFSECRQQVVSSKMFPLCFESNSANKIMRQNNEYSDQVRRAEAAVCIVRDNYPNEMDRFFAVPASIDVATISPARAPDWFQEGNRATFMSGDPLPAVYALKDGDSHTIQTRANGFLAMPSPTDFQKCSRDHTVKFLTPAEMLQCKIYANNLQELCSAASTADFLSLGLAPPEFGFIDVSSIVPVVARFFNAQTSEYLGLQDPSGAFTTTSLSENTTFDGTTTFDEGSNTCFNALERAILTVSYAFSEGQSGRIVAASVDLYVRNAVGAQLSFPVSFQQSSLVKFRDADATTEASFRPNTPGYFAGHRVQAGTEVASGTKTAVQQELLGFSVPHGRLCSEKKFRPVEFLHDVLNSGCGVRLTEAEFLESCSSSNAALTLLEEVISGYRSESSNNLFGNTNVSAVIDRIGRTADSIPENINDWVPITGFPLERGGAGVYNNILRQCSGTTVGLHYAFIVGRAGAEHNPQDVILGARVQPITGSWAFRPAADGVSVQFFTFRVTFIRYLETSKATKQRRVVAPPILPEVDDNVFYPFKYPGRQSEEESV